MVFNKKYDRLQRLRIQIPSLDEKRLNGLEKVLNQMEGVSRCEANFLTGSLTICYDEGQRERILSYLSELPQHEIPLGTFHQGMIKKDYIQRTAEAYAKKAVIGLLFPKMGHFGKCFK